MATTIQDLGSALERFFVIRESSRYALQLLEGMAFQTLKPHEDLPGVTDALKAGLRPFEDPEAFDGLVLAGPGYRAVMFVIEGTLFLYWAGSAAQVDQAGDNAFTRELARLVKRFRPRDVYSSSFGRLVRSDQFSPDLKAALQGAGTTVHVSEFRLDMSLPTSSVIWDLLVFMSSEERRAIENRTTLGILFRARKTGLPPFKIEEALPLGYVLETVEDDDEDGSGIIRPVDDPEVREHVRKMIDVLGRDCVARRKVEQLADLGVSNGYLRRLHSPDATISDATGPSPAVRTLNNWYELYRTGTFTMRRKIPKTSLAEYGGYPVETEEWQASDGTTHVQQYVSLSFTWGLPEGGWASEEAFERWQDEISRSQQRQATTGGQAHRRHKPLCGYPTWVHDGMRYILRSYQGDKYEIRRRDLEVEGGWEHRKSQSEQVAKVRAADLHGVIADTAVAKLTDGAPMSFTPVVEPVVPAGDGEAPVLVVADPATRRRRLRKELEDLREQLEHTTTREQQVKAAATRASYARRAEELGERIEDVEARLAQLDEGADPPNDAPLTVQLDVQTLLHAMAMLKSVDGPVSHELSEDVMRLIPRVELYPTDEGGVTVEFDLLLPGEGYLIRVERLTADVPLAPAGTMVGHTSDYEAETQDVVATLRSGGCINELANRISTVPASAPNRLRAALRRAYPHGSDGTIYLALRHPVVEVRQALASHLDGETPNTIEPHVWVAVRDTTDRGDQPAMTRLLRQATTLQTRLDRVAQLGGTLSLEQALELPELRLARTIERNGRRSPRWLYSGYRIRNRWIRVDLFELEGGHIRVRSCPTCADTRLRVVVLPELGGLLCPRCSCDIDTGQPWPEGYLDLADHSRWPLISQPSDRNLTVAQGLREALPEEPFTYKHAARLLKCHQSAGQRAVDQLVEAGVLEMVGYAPNPDGGLRPRLFARTAAAAC